MTFIRLALAALFLMGGASSYAGSPHVASPQLFEELTVHFGAERPSVPLPGPGLRVFVWNIFKGSNPAMTQDFQIHSAGVDLALFQEAISHPEFAMKLAAANPNLGWTLAKSFSVAEESFTGVATASQVRPAKEEVIISVPTEPIRNTRKTILLSQYFVAFQAEPLLVANIHAINFVPTSDFKVQIQQLLVRVREHRGPLLIAGDFNTWNRPRMDYLRTEFSKIGLKLLHSATYKFLTLDHIFARGLKIQLVTDLRHVRSSDHTPMKVDLLFETPATVETPVGPLSVEIPEDLNVVGAAI